MGTSTAVNRTKHATTKSHESLCIHSHKSTWFSIHKYITFGDNISNTFIKSNMDRNMDQNTSTTYVLPYSKPNISYIAVIINPTDYVFNIHKIHSQILDSKMRSRSLQGFAFTRGLSAYKHKTTRIRKHKQNYEKRKKI